MIHNAMTLLVLNGEKPQVRDPVNPSLTRKRAKRPRREVETRDFGAMLKRLLSAYGRRVAVGDVEDLADMLGLARHLDELVRDAVTRLRAEQEFSWTDIARACGTSRQAAQQRYGGGDAA